MRRLRPSLDWLLVLVPVSMLELAGGNELLIFLTSAGAILPLAGLIGRATEQLALHTGPRIGGLVNATFGNVTELVIAFFLILEDKTEIVKASLTGSILGNLLLVLGLSFLLAGGLSTRSRPTTPGRPRSTRPRCRRHAAADAGALRGLAAVRAQLVEREVVSGTVSAVLIALYVAARCSRS